MQRSLMNRRRVLAAVLGFVMLTAANCSGNKGVPSSQQQGQAVTETYAPKLTNAQPYPLSQMNDSAERANLKERLLRLNNPNKAGFFYGLNNLGAIMLYTPVKGKVSSIGSQLTPTQNIVDGSGNNGGGNQVIDSMGDDGSFGPEECQSQGVFGFTPAGVMFEWCGPWIYSDAPLHLSSAPLITYDANAVPSSTAGK